ncbi:hypothetical protein PsYK624_145110 [Phanerochaete sordida]|uniref:Uncharacterized protein n=1 Tax=Phanerochaete sordida TaxID=48140 RepID=A0A9P3GMU2_9APHY|nr:hypothetical protein PsYK624_145110 [Phanerochaete sordida]
MRGDCRGDFGLTAHKTYALLHGADVLVLVVTWAKTYHQWQNSRRLSVALPVTSYLIRDGTFYFLVLLGMNAGILAGSLTSTQGFNAVGAYLPPVVISRFLLHLRDCTDAGEPTNSLLPRLSNLNRDSATSHVIGNIGASLDYSQAERFGSDDEDDMEVRSVSRPIDVSPSLANDSRARL